MLGGDTRFMTEDGSWLAGVAMSSAKGDMTTMQSKGDTEGYSFHAYLSRQYNNGIFIDTAAQFGHYSNTADVRLMNGGGTIKADFNTNGFGAMVKGGYTWKDGNGLFIQPYAKLSALTLEGVDYQLNGVDVHSDSYNSVLGEAGTRVGYDFAVGNSTVKPYLNLAALNEFSDGNKVRLGDESVNASIDGAAFRVGAGVQADLHPQHFPDERSRNIYLALPVASDVRNEISDGRRIGRYRLNYADVRDLHSEEGDARTLTLGQLTPRIMSGAEDMSAYITLPLCRISDRHADGSLTLDDDFIPSCQNIQVSKKLRVYLKEVQGAIGGRASDLANRIGSPAQSGIADVAEFMMLQLLNRNQTRFTHRARRSQLHPEDFYLDLAGLLGELMTFTELSRLPCPLDVYDHHDLTKTFKTLLPEVKRALHTVLSPRAVNLPLHLRDGIWQADIHDTELLQSATFVLAVAANMPVDQIQRQFIQQSKISSPEKIRNMVSVQIPGIPLRALMVAPRQLPYHSGFSYFELDKSGQAWTEMAAAGAVALHVSGSFPDLNMQLWAIRG